MTDKKDKTTVPIHALGKHATRPIVPVDPLIGHRIAGRYELLQPLARGGFGKVYKARDTKLERIVAIKLVDIGHASEDTRARMLREARANARLHHPNVVVLHDAGEDPFGLYLVLEYIAGTSLAEVLSGGPLPAHRAAEITRECALALAAAHAHGIVHRDIKPANILLTESGRVKVADFGVARMVGEARLTDRGSIIGTPNYMAPEQVDGAEVGPEADMFALGCVLYEMLAGRPPFDGATTSEVLGRILRGTPDPMPPLEHTVAPLVDVVTALLDKNAKRRLMPNELIERLRSWERQESSRHSRTGRGGRVAAIAAVAVIAAVFGASIALRDREEPPPAPPPASLLVRVADTPASGTGRREEVVRFSSRDSLFAYMEFLGRDREHVRRVDEETIAIEGESSLVKAHAEEARLVGQLHGYDFFRESSRFVSGAPSSRLVSCDFEAIRPSEIVALLSAAAGWPVVQSADEPLESSTYIRVSAVNQPWDEVAIAVLRAAGLSAHRYETIWLVTSEDVRIVPPWKAALVVPRRFSTEEVRQRFAGAAGDGGVAWRVEAEGTEAAIVVADTNGLSSALRSIDDVRAPDWVVASPPRFSRKAISLRLDDAPLTDVLAFYSNMTKQPVTPASGINGWVRANIVEIPADEYLAAVLDANGLTTTASASSVSATPFATESIEVSLANVAAEDLDPLRALAAHAATTTGMPATITATRGGVRIEARSDVARNLAAVVETIDSLLAR